MGPCNVHDFHRVRSSQRGENALSCVAYYTVSPATLKHGNIICCNVCNVIRNLKKWLIFASGQKNCCNEQKSALFSSLCYFLPVALFFLAAGQESTTCYPRCRHGMWHFQRSRAKMKMLSRSVTTNQSQASICHSGTNAKIRATDLRWNNWMTSSGKAVRLSFRRFSRRYYRPTSVHYQFRSWIALQYPLATRHSFWAIFFLKLTKKKTNEGKKMRN